MPFLLAEILNFQGSTHRIGVGSFSDLSVSDLTRAAELNWNDFEDAVQSVTAERIHADYIITKNVRDFSKSKVMAFTHSELLARIWENFTVPDPL